MKRIKNKQKENIKFGGKNKKKNKEGKGKEKSMIKCSEREEKSPFYNLDNFLWLARMYAVNRSFLWHSICTQ